MDVCQIKGHVFGVQLASWKAYSVLIILVESEASWYEKLTPISPGITEPNTDLHSNEISNQNESKSKWKY